MPNAANTAEVVAAARRRGARRRRGGRPAPRRTACWPCRARAPPSCSAGSGCRPSTRTCRSRPAELDGRVDDGVPDRLHRRARLRAACRAGPTPRRVWDALLDAGADLGVRPCGLGARDTLRTEMGYPLHGQDLSRDITPVQARSGWAVGWDKPAFWGRDALLAERAAGARRAAVGPARAGPRHPAPAHAGARRATAAAVGEVTSGTFSPTLRQGIGLALLDRTVRRGRRGDRGRARPAVADARGQAAVRAPDRPALTGGGQPAGFSCTVQLLPSGSSKNTNEFHGRRDRPPTRRRRRAAPGSRRRRGRPAVRGPPRRRRRRAADPSASPAASPSDPVPTVTEQADPGGVSWTTRVVSLTCRSTSTTKPTCSL